MEKQIKAARRAGVPLVAISTPDPAQTIKEASEALDSVSVKCKVQVKVQWDIASGMSGVSKLGGEFVKSKIGSGDPTVGNPISMLNMALEFPANSVLFVHMGHKVLDLNQMCLQAIWNLRDAFKSSRRMLVLLGPSFRLPAEVKHDILLLDREFPDKETLRELADGVIESAVEGGVEEPSEEVVVRSVEAMSGLSSYAAEQSLAMSITKSGIDVDDVWERKRKMIDQSPALTVCTSPERFDDIGGCDQIKKFLGRLISGKMRPNIVVLCDEIEKSVSSNNNDTSGVSQDQLGEKLKFMQDHAADGVILVGPPGAAKSAIAKCLGNMAECPTVMFDLGAAKGSLVGESEQNIREAFKTIKAVGGDRILFVATSNNISALPPELRRRYTMGTWFFDLPSSEEREKIWEIYRDKYDTTGDVPGDEGWTGAEIKTCARMSEMLGCTLEEASEYLVPVSRSAPETIESLRSSADGRYLSASHPGTYVQNRPEGASVSGRAFDFSE